MDFNSFNTKLKWVLKICKVKAIELIRALAKVDACGRGRGGRSQMQTSAFGIVLNVRVKKEKLYPHQYFMQFFLFELHHTLLIQYSPVPRARSSIAGKGAYSVARAQIYAINRLSYFKL